MLADVTEFFIHEARIERASVSGFDQTTTWSELSTVPAYIWASSGDESIDYGGENVRAAHRMVCAVTDITAADRVVEDGSVYMVRFVDTKKIHGESWLQIDLEYVGAAQ